MGPRELRLRFDHAQKPWCRGASWCPSGVVKRGGRGTRHEAGEPEEAAPRARLPPGAGGDRPGGRGVVAGLFGTEHVWVGCGCAGRAVRRAGTSARRPGAPGSVDGIQALVVGTSGLDTPPPARHNAEWHARENKCLIRQLATCRRVEEHQQPLITAPQAPARASSPAPWPSAPAALATAPPTATPPGSAATSSSPARRSSSSTTIRDRRARDGSISVFSLASSRTDPCRG